MVFAGRELDKQGPQRLALASGIVMGLGYLLAGLLGATNFWVVAICIGLIGGAGIGIGYVVPIAVGMRWFPDKKGMITGLAVAGFGFGAFGWIQLAGSWGNLIANLGLGTTFVIYGIAFAAIVIVGALWMKMPPKDWKPEGYTPPVAARGQGGDSYTAVEMLRTPQFYLIFFTFAVSAGAGLMSVGLMKLYPMEVLQASGYDLAASSAISGLAMAVFFSLANGAGRIVWGMISDVLGRKNSIIVMMVLQGIFVFAFTLMAGNEYLLYLGAMLIGFNFGGNFALFPTITADIFGTATVGRNYPYVFLSYGVGGIVFPILGGMLGDLGNFPLAFTICAVALIVGAVATALIKPLDRAKATG
jgi:MFS transporter, OFA family, oxalate/formate antiporter